MAAPLSQRGGLAIGVPFGQQFGGLGRNSVSVPESSTNSNASPVCFFSWLDVWYFPFCGFI